MGFTMILSSIIDRRSPFPSIQTSKMIFFNFVFLTKETRLRLSLKVSRYVKPSHPCNPVNYAVPVVFKGPCWVLTFVSASYHLLKGVKDKFSRREVTSRIKKIDCSEEATKNHVVATFCRVDWRGWSIEWQVKKQSEISEFVKMVTSRASGKFSRPLTRAR